MLDIGTEAVKSLMFEPTDDGVTVYGFIREPHNTGDVQRGSIVDHTSVVITSAKAIADVEKSSKLTSQEMVVIMGGDFLNALPVVFQDRRQNPDLKINEVELKNIFHKIYAKSVEKIRAYHLQESSYVTGDIKIVDAYIQDIKIDGYDIENPIGLDGKVISFNIFYSFLPSLSQELLTSISDIVKKRISQIYSPSFSVSAIIKKDMYPLSDFITIDIGGASTELALTRKGMVIGTRNFQLGGRTITQRIASSLGIGFWEAEEVKLAHTTKRLSSYVSRKIVDIIKRDLELWYSGLELALKEISFLNILPRDIFIYGGASAFIEFRDMLYKTDWYQSLPFPEKPIVKFLDTNSIKGVTLSGFKDNAVFSDIVPFAASRVFKERMARYRLQDMFEKIIHMMQKT